VSAYLGSTAFLGLLLEVAGPVVIVIGLVMTALGWSIQSR